ncbi:hypothetical protein SAMN05660493_00563 [Epilithonimonas bovis DSM 19482]|jgi:hypothetical protein|uniref:Uncharacterized protein n=1 Tax=Epilithonimonas bovis DSM 19482 TaxID=1121284 RepID=A0A1U7PTQ4_9FLAO|nr:hypothetical protein SAMN05660493_00563 [Epilithonimonas bovis DSM 19482]
MFGIILSAFMLVFGIFLKLTKNPGFASSKRFSWLFILLGIITLIGKIIILNQKGEL